ncbi:hypothetical protein [Bdellovibrio sp. HCB337]|uniref:hypothetical protein n=1 Tax=Bdellovibrio sp. HCB337 TaxID=3394358 RepID=UPI0039A50C2D
MKKYLFALVVLAASSSFAGGTDVGSGNIGTDNAPIRVKGIVCEAQKSINGAKPFVIIKDISDSNATLMLQKSDEIPDVRNAELTKVVENGKLVVGYISLESAMNPYAPNFAVHTDGSTPQDTTTAVLTFDQSNVEIKMSCRDGMK